jgi:glycosyltransferase involved in cell wall biosynthesis
MMQALLVANFNWAGISTPLINTAGFLLDEGWSVKIFVISPDFGRFPFPKDIETRAQIIAFFPTKRSLQLGYILTALRLFSEARKSSLTFLFDAEALLNFLPIPGKRSSATIYYSLEFYEPKKRFARSRKQLERVLANNCSGTITQSGMRAAFLKRQGIRTDIWIVPNSPRGPYLGNQQSFSLSWDETSTAKFVLLCIGTLGHETRVDEILSWYSNNQACCSLLLHGWFVSDDVKSTAMTIAFNNKESVRISTDLKDEVEKWSIYEKCDAVFVGFSSKSPNYQLAAGSAGKLYDAIRTGKPVIALNSPGMRDIVEKLGIGVVVNRIYDLGDAIRQIKLDSSFYKRNCEAAHNHFSHDQHLRKVVEGALSAK